MAAAILVTFRSLVKKLKEIFYEENKIDQKYTEVWLSGGLIREDKVIVNVNARQGIDSVNPEIKKLTYIFFDRLTREERSLIWRLNVHKASEEAHYEDGDFLVYSNEEAEAL